jgi:serine/threonine protein kinase
MDERLPGYVLHHRVGVGANAEVYRAEPAGSPGRIVAVKRLRIEAPARAVDELRREAAALTRLSHPSILRLLDLVVDGDRVALVVPFTVGGSLADRLAAVDGGLPPAEVADLGARIARALAAAHNAGLVHRDVKPANLLFDAEGQPLLSDFGTAHLTGERTPVAGTAEYLDPAVLAGAPADARSDVYGLGVTLYEALAGVPPYAGSTARQTLAAADRGVHVPLTELVDAPAALIETIERAMARDPGARHATASELAGRLDEARRHLEAVRPELPVPPPPPTPGSAGVLGAQSAREDVPAPHAPATAAPRPPAAPSVTAPATPEVEPGSRRSDEDRVGEGPQRSGTRLFGPAPPAPVPTSSATRGVDRRLLVVAAALIVAIPVGLTWWLPRGGDEEVELTRDAPSSQATDEARTDGTGIDGTVTEDQDTAGGSTDATALDARPSCAGTPAHTTDGEVHDADIEGRGCTVPVAWDGQQLHVPLEDGTVARYDLAASPEDVLVLGDWSCDGRDTPALYRPDDGRVFVFDEFSDDATARGTPAGVTDGKPVVVLDAHGCPQLRIEPAP